MTDRLQPLTRADCLRLLGQRSLGRVAFTERALPAIRPVGYTLLGAHLLLRTAAGLGRRLDGQVVAFEVDEVDAERDIGWSVVLTGTARLVCDPGELMRLDSVPFRTLAGAGHDLHVCITPGDITGRTFRSQVTA